VLDGQVGVIKLGSRAPANHISLTPMPSVTVPPAAVRAEIPHPIRLQIVSPCAKPPEGDGWLHEIKHDGHRLVAIVADGAVKLLSRNARDRTELFAEPFRALAAAGLPAMVLDGEIAVPDDNGVTHIDGLTEALRQRRNERLAYFAFDLLHLDGHDLRPCAIEDRKALLRGVVGAVGGPRLVTVDHIVGSGAALLAAVRQLGAEGIVSKRAGSPYRGGRQSPTLVVTRCRPSQSKSLFCDAAQWGGTGGWAQVYTITPFWRLTPGTLLVTARVNPELQTGDGPVQVYVCPFVTVGLKKGPAGENPCAQAAKARGPERTPGGSFVCCACASNGLTTAEIKATQIGNVRISSLPA
jgi:hypothetical protein